MTPRTPLIALPECEIRVNLGTAVEVGDTASGHRRFIPIVGGEIRGLSGTELEGMYARILVGGSDRQRVRSDGTLEIDAQYEAANLQGALLLIRARGVRYISDTGTYFRVNITFEGDAAAYPALQHALWFADGVREEGIVTHTVYRVQ